jgi:hypothetical protein
MRTPGLFGSNFYVSALYSQDDGKFTRPRAASCRHVLRRDGCARRYFDSAQEAGSPSTRGRQPSRPATGATS